MNKKEKLELEDRIKLLETRMRSPEYMSSYSLDEREYDARELQRLRDQVKVFYDKAKKDQDKLRAKRESYGLVGYPDPDLVDRIIFEVENGISPEKPSRPEKKGLLGSLFGSKPTSEELIREIVLKVLHQKKREAEIMKAYEDY